jgi:hypothetical protein
MIDAVLAAEAGDNAVIAIVLIEIGFLLSGRGMLGSSRARDGPLRSREGLLQRLVL